MEALRGKLKNIAETYKTQKEHIHTEEATKNALVMPFISALGYNVFNPSEVIPEFTADVALAEKKGEKIDYAIKKDGKIIILIECKSSDTVLNNTHVAQLFRYFSVTESHLGILTNGIDYWFYSDLDNKNKMDERPFYEFSLLSFDDEKLNEVKKYCNQDFSIDNIISNASNLKYTNGIKQNLKREIETPSEDFIRALTNGVYMGRMTQNVKEQFQKIVKKAISQFISDKINQQLEAVQNINKEETQAVEAEIASQETAKDKIVTTEEELQGFYIVKGIVGEIERNLDRINYTDYMNFFSIFIDGSRSWFGRLFFNNPEKKILVLKGETVDQEYPIEKVSDIYKYKSEILSAYQFVNGSKN